MCKKRLLFNLAMNCIKRNCDEDGIKLVAKKMIRFVFKR